MKKVLIAVVALVVVFFGIKLIFNNGDAVDPRAAAAAYLTQQLDGLNCDLSKLKMKVAETDEEGVTAVIISGAIKCEGTLVVKADDDTVTVAPMVDEKVVKAAPAAPEAHEAVEAPAAAHEPEAAAHEPVAEEHAEEAVHH